MRTLACFDLDGTVIHSRRALLAHGDSIAGLACVETTASSASYLRVRTLDSLRRLVNGRFGVPITIRSVEQYLRLTLFDPAEPPPYALVANGGVLLVDGVPDPDWSADVAASYGACADRAEVRHVFDRTITCMAAPVKSAADLFFYAVIPRGAAAPVFGEFAAWCAERRWRVVRQGRKVYVLPQHLGKDDSALRLQARLGAGQLVAAGDGALDADLLQHARRAIVGAHSELAVAGWSVPHLELAPGGPLDSADAIVDWLHRAAS